MVEKKFIKGRNDPAYSSQWGNFIGRIIFIKKRPSLVEEAGL